MNTKYKAAVILCVAGLALTGARPAAKPAGAGTDKPRPAVSSEADTWLAALRTTPADDLKFERVLVIDADGRILDRAEGQRSTVGFPDRFLPFLRQPTPTVSLVHNHPGSRGLSADDLCQLAHPGVLRVIAVGNDGSLYEARRGPAFRVETFSREYLAARNALEHDLGRALPPNTKPDDRLQALFAHGLALKLAKAGVLDYRAVLAPRQQELWNILRIWYQRAGAV
jgi:hypothetical protein